MRLWSLHPCYLDAKGIVACWREGLLARKVLLGETKGYKNHPQLSRFKQQPNPVGSVDGYLLAIYEEATRRGYHFGREKIGNSISDTLIDVTDCQLVYELQHLLAKLKVRDITRFENIKNIKTPLPHPVFRVIHGDIEVWERNR